MTVVGGLAAMALGLLLCFPTAVAAQTVPFGATNPEVPTAKHEPVFGIGPQTIWEGGIGAGLAFEYGRRADPGTDEVEEERALHAHVDY
ncbi:MAG: hypothetical protein ABEJ00_00595, partial [Gemmatimonadota bacterium]